MSLVQCLVVQHPLPFHQPECVIDRPHDGLPKVPYPAIEAAVSHVFEIDPGLLKHSSRGAARIALARQVAMYLAHVACQMSYTDVGHLFHRDRTTVAHGCGVVEDRRDDPRFDRVVDLLELVVTALRPASGGALQRADRRS